MEQILKERGQFDLNIGFFDGLLKLPTPMWCVEP